MIPTCKKRRLIHIVLIGLSLIKPPVSLAQMEDTTRYPANIELEEVSVIGQGISSLHSEITGKVIIITTEEIKSSPALSIEDLLDYMAGIDIRQRNIHGVQADVELRGGTFDQVLILLNGINITDPQTGHFSLNLPVELSMIERIEIIHGSGSKIYGSNAYKGVINIITRKKENYAGTGLSIGQHKLFHSHINANLVKGRLHNGLSYSRNTSDGYTENTDYKLNHLYYQGGLNLKPAEISWQAGMNRKAYGANDFYSPSFPDQYEETSTRFSSLSISSKSKIKLSASGYWRRHKDHFLLKRNDPSFYENYHLTDVLGINLGARLSSKFGKSFMGFEVRDENIYSTILGNEADNPFKIKGTDNTFYTKFYSRNTFNSTFEHQYSRHNFSISGSLLIRIHPDFKDNPVIFPGLNASHKFAGDKIKLFASINRSMRMPTFTDLFYKDPSNEGNSDLVPEELTALEMGMEYKRNGIFTDFTVFSDHGKQVIDWVWVPDKLIYKAMNVSGIITKGFEISCKYERPMQYIGSLLPQNTGVSYTYIVSDKTTSDYESKYSLDHLKHKFRMYALQDITKKIHINWQISFNSRNGSYLDFDPDTETRFTVPFRSYWLIDMKVFYSARFMNIFTGVSNLLNTKYNDVGNLIQPGRWINAGFELNLSLDNKL